MTSPVCIEVQVVAAGPISDNESVDTGKVRLTLSLMPVAASPNRTKIDVAEWPKEIDKWLTGNTQWPLALRCKPIRGNSENKPERLTLEYRPDHTAEIQGIWDEIVEWASRGIDLIDIKLGEFQTGVTDPSLQALTQQFWEALAQVMTERSDPSVYMVDKEARVLPTARADAAVRCLLDQAERAAARFGQDTTSYSNDQPASTSKQPAWSKVKEGYVAAPEDVGARTDETDREKQQREKQQKVEEANLTKENMQIEIEANFRRKARYGFGPSVKELFDLSSSDILEQAQVFHLAAMLPDAERKPEQLPRGALSPERVKRLLDSPPTTPVDESAELVARTFIAAIRSSPMLARLFRFVVDIEVPVSELHLNWETGNSGGEVSFALLGAEEANREFDTTLFSLAKARRVDGRLTAFWPATKEELDAHRKGLEVRAMRQSGEVSQIDGVLDLGQVSDKDGSRSPRFDIVSIDPVLAMEASVRNVRREYDPDSVAASARREPETGITSRGLAIVDRGRADSVAEEIRKAQEVRPFDGTPKAGILDADDLTIGYRVDVKVRTEKESPDDWHSLMEREIDYRRLGQEQQGTGDDFDRWFSAMKLKFETDRRRDYDAGIMMPTARRRLLAKDEMIHAEELIAVWEGDPLGLNCHSDTVAIRPGSDVAISRFYNLPSEGDEEEKKRKAWPLRYGWSYRFGIRPVWLGGVSLRLQEVNARYDTPAGDSLLCLPGGRKVGGKWLAEGWRRFLRHDPILAPVVLLPAAVARETSPYVGQSGIRAILRSTGMSSRAMPHDAYRRERNYEKTWRVILPPQISLDEAIRHGEFDHLHPVGKTPPGGLLDIDYDHPTNDGRFNRAAGRITKPGEVQGQTRSFPAMRREGPAGLGDGTPEPAVYEDYFRVHYSPIDADTRGDAKHQYYVDPMASCLVIAIRPNNDTPGRGYFDGTRMVVGSRGGKMPIVALRIEKAAARDPRVLQRKPQQADFWDKRREASRFGHINGEGFDRANGPGAVEARIETLRLAPGESVDVDCWFVPSVAELLADWALPETLVALATAEAEREGNGEATPIKMLKKKLGYADAIPASDWGKYAEQPAWIGLGGQEIDPELVAVAAELVHRHMLTKPLPEISAVRTIDVVHAVARPPRPPRFEGQLALLRADNTPERRKDVLLGEASRPGEDGVVATGLVLMDRDTCRTLEIRVEGTDPGRPLDDTRLGRTELQRLLGEWPERFVPPDSKNDKDKKDKEAGGGDARPDEKAELSGEVLVASRSARYLFGFGVDGQGNVDLPRHTRTLIALDDLAERGSDSTLWGLEQINLAEAQIEAIDGKAGKSGKRLPRASLPTGYADPLARKVTLTLRATSRFDPYFVRLAPLVATEVPESQFPPDPKDAGLITRLSYEPNAEGAYRGDTKQLQECWIPATVAPAKPAIHAVLPAFHVESSKPAARSGPQVWRHTRTSRLRVLLDRPWFSSGEDEQLGIVLWPPNIQELQAMGKAPTFEKSDFLRAGLHTLAAEDSEEMKLDDFEDEDLGPGGRFTTRWGTDPTRPNGGPKGKFMTAEALLGARRKPPLEHAPGYVASIAVPLTDLRERHEQKPRDDKQADKKPPDEPYESLTAALATYVPRFDVETEKWFVDLDFYIGEMVEPFVRLGLVRYQPHALDELRVSAPVTAWAQILPRRSVKVMASDQGQGWIAIDVRVDGPGLAPLDDNISANAERRHPGMRIRIVERLQTVAGMFEERTTRCVGPNFETDVEADRVITGSRDATFLIVPSGGPDRPLGRPVTKRQLAVLVEEFEDLQSTADEDFARYGSDGKTELDRKPVDATEKPYDDAGPGRQRSGPRFLARLDIEIPFSIA